MKISGYIIKAKNSKCLEQLIKLCEGITTINSDVNELTIMESQMNPELESVLRDSHLYISFSHTTEVI